MERNSWGNKFSKRQRTRAMLVLNFTIFFIIKSTWSFLPCPIMLLTMLLLVEANAQLIQPNMPNTFRITFEMACGISEDWFLSIRIKKNSQLIILIAC